MNQIIKYPLYLLELAGSAKSFLQNPVIGSEKLNTWGLHKKRVQVAAAMASFRRSRLAKLLDPVDRRQLESEGYLVRENYLPEVVFNQLNSELYARPMAAREMRQGQTVTRLIPVGPSVQRYRPVLKQYLKNRYLKNLIRYAASYGGEPVFMIQVIIADPSVDEVDPQTDLHSDTFHSTAKAWFFLHDVGPDDGPFIYVPRSHLLTPERLEWEYEQSMTARADSRLHHSLGSFRVTGGELEAFGYTPRKFTVKANTLVIADTRGFHGRTPSSKQTVRVSLDAYLRRNPFVPWNGLDLFSIPGMRGRTIDFYHHYLDFMEKKFSKRTIWRDVGDSLIDAPARI